MRNGLRGKRRKKTKEREKTMTKLLRLFGYAWLAIGSIALTMGYLVTACYRESLHSLLLTSTFFAPGLLALAAAFFIDRRRRHDYQRAMGLHPLHPSRPQ
jgi:FtsH-binding integral membrane protein